MKFLSIDTETTGTDPRNNQILEIAIIAVDTLKPRNEWPVLHTAVSHPKYIGSAYAINLNARLFDLLKRHEAGQQVEQAVTHIDNLAVTIGQFLESAGYELNSRGTYTVFVAGKNPHGFDIAFMKNTIPDIEQFVTFGHRSLDPAILFMDHENDTVPPGLSVCKERAGLGSIVTHNAKDDAFDVVDLIFIGKGITEVETKNNEDGINV